MEELESHQAHKFNKSQRKLGEKLASTLQPSSNQPSTIQPSTIQPSTNQPSTIQHSTSQHTAETSPLQDLSILVVNKITNKERIRENNIKLTEQIRTRQIASKWRSIFRMFDADRSPWNDEATTSATTSDASSVRML